MPKIRSPREKRIMYGKCDTCVVNIPIEHYFAVRDEICCQECGTSYILTSKDPVKLERTEQRYDSLEDYGDNVFEGYN